MTEIKKSYIQDTLELLVANSREPGKVAVYEDLARRLSMIAAKENAWTWRYVQSVHMGSMQPSEKFARAVSVLAAEMDGLPAVVAETEPITVYARPGTVRANAIVIGESKACASPACTIHFIPRVPWQKYCPNCRDKKQRRKR